MQLDVGVSPPANIISLKLTLTRGQVQKIWPQRPYSSEKLGSNLRLPYCDRSALKRPTSKTHNQNKVDKGFGIWCPAQCTDRK